ncbi:hypothetical protein Vadar_013086 [Vaccinium darrowii]|uniref:Uncharacterized protein n=1 Tax=Vaccinium darrowii TaxID=229202 RepID=A0ACB7XH94_9ERIC|nr:hypothetical protein Vadar_013086 [Vaccinium darrowii]
MKLYQGTVGPAWYWSGGEVRSVGLLQEEVDPMVSVMKVKKAPLESYADIGWYDAHESLDPALLQLDLMDRKIEFPLPDIKTRMHIFTVLAWLDQTNT